MATKNTSPNTQGSKRTFSIYWLVCLILIIIGVYVVYTQFSFNFLALGILLLALCTILPARYYYKKYHKVRGRGKREIVNVTRLSYDYALWGGLFITFFGCMCVYTINNYFSPDARVFNNADHHVMSIKGLEISNPDGFLLAANSKDALFDTDATTGTVTISHHGDDAVTLDLSPDFRRAIYLEEYDGNRLVELNVLNNLPTFDKNSSLTLRTVDGSQYQLSSQMVKDTITYTLGGITSDSHSYLVKGLPLSSVLNGIGIDSLGLDLEGIHLIRPKALITKTTDDLKKKYYTDQAFAIEVQSRHNSTTPKTVAAISDGTHEWNLLSNNASHQTVDIPIGRYFSIGYDGKRSPSMKFEYTDAGTLKLVYRQPLMKYLSPDPDRPDNVVLLTQSLNCSSDGIDDTYRMLPDNIMLFDIFSHVDNINRVSPKYLTYTTEQSKVKLYVDVYDYLSGGSRNSQTHQSLEDGVRVEGTRAISNPTVNWIIELTNLKAQSIYQPWKIKWVIFIFTICLALLLLYGNVNTVGFRVQRLIYTNVEYIAYMITLFLVTVRWFLLWRASVFPPVDHVSAYEFGMYQRYDNLRNLLWVMGGFVIVVGAIKYYFINIKAKKLKAELAQKSAGKAKTNAKTSIFDRYLTIPLLDGLSMEKAWKRTLFLVSLPVGYGLLLLAIGFVTSFIGTWARIFFVIIAYLLTTLFIHHTFSDSYIRKKTQKVGNKHTLGGKGHFALVGDAINSLVTSAVLLYFDSGYGILFFTYSIFWLLWDMFDYTRHANDRFWDKNRWARYLLPALFLAFGVLVVKYRWVFKHLAEGGVTVYLCMAAAGALLAILISLIVVGQKSTIKHWRRVGIAVGICAVVFGASAWGVNYFLGHKAQHTVERIKVLSVEPDDALLSIEDNATQRRYIQAAVNHMIIGEYNERGSYIDSFGADGVGYFKMQPHSTVGAMWGAQLTDISLVRFLIAEHTQYLGFLLISLYLLMLVVGARETKHHRYARCMLIQIPLLLFIQSLLIWMANTQKFVFLGQDFPMISINSTISLALYFSLVIVWLYYAFSEVISEPEIGDNLYFGINEKDTVDYSGLNPFEIAQEKKRGLNSSSDMGVDVPTWSRHESIILFASLFICLISVVFIEAKKYDFTPHQAMTAVKKAVEGDDVYALLDDSNSSTDEDTDIADPVSLNGWLIKYQQDGNRLRSMSPTDLTAFINDFNSEYADQIAACFGAHDNIDEAPLGKNIWDNYVRDGVKKNNRNHVIHARIINHKKQKYVVMAVSNKFFDQKLPTGVNDQWEGSLVASNYSGNTAPGTIRANGTSLHRLPGTWLRSGTMTPIISGNALVEGNGMLMPLSRDGASSAAQLTHGFTVRDARFAEEIPHVDYLARNVRVNGARMFVYPLGERLFWAYNFANELYGRKYAQSEEKKSAADYHYDANLTLSYELQNTIYDIFKDSEREKRRFKELAVIIANGDGDIAAMVDYKRNYKLNPNDRRRISYITDSLYMIGQEGGTTSRGYFGNNNLVAITFGPGSTQKPLTWTAVAAGIDYPWRDLKIEPYQYIPRDTMVINGTKGSGRHFVINKFNGREFLSKHPFLPLTSDESGGTRIGVSEYMSNSSNVYNALMAYIGSWPIETYSNQFMTVSPQRDSVSLFARMPAGWRQKDRYLSLFPILSNGGSTFSLNAHPTRSNADWLKNSLLQVNMQQLFGINPEYIDWSQRTKYGTNIAKGRDGLLSWSLAEGFEAFSTDTVMPASMSYVEPSALIADARAEDPAPLRQNFFLEEAIRKTAIGSQKVWNVTPLKMAEAFGRMASLNQNYRLNVFSNGNNAYKLYDPELISQGYLDARQSQFTGLHDIFHRGTASSLGNLATNSRANGYWLYAKTGTIAPSKTANDRHRFAVIIANKDISNTPAEELDDLKYYVLYFTADEKDTWTYYARTIEALINSDNFKKYMHPDTDHE